MNTNGKDEKAAKESEKYFNFSREMMAGPIYRKYEKAINGIWNPRDLDYAQDIEDWKDLSEERRSALLGITVRFFAGEQIVAEDVVPMLVASRPLGRYDWVMFLGTFAMEEAKHAEFFAHWHATVVGILDPPEVGPVLPDAREDAWTRAAASRSRRSPTKVCRNTRPSSRRRCRRATSTRSSGTSSAT